MKHWGKLQLSQEGLSKLRDVWSIRNLQVYEVFDPRHLMVQPSDGTACNEDLGNACQMFVSRELTQKVNNLIPILLI